MPKILSETVKNGVTKKGNRYLVTIAKPGKGSTGTYTEEMLREYGPIAFPPGVRSYMGHEEPHKRNPKDLVGKFPEGAFWNEEEGALQGVLEARNPLLAGFIEDMYEDLDMSMYVLDFDKDPNSDEITRLGYTRANSIDIVGIGGIEGAGIKELVESYSTADTSTDEAVEENRKKMEIKELGDLVKGLAAEITEVKTFISEQKDAAKAEADKKAEVKTVEESVSEAVAAYDAKIAQIEEARKDLTASQIESLRSLAKEGADVAPVIEQYRNFVKEAIEAAESAELSESFVLPTNNSGSGVTGFDVSKIAFGG